MAQTALELLETNLIKFFDPQIKNGQLELSDIMELAQNIEHQELNPLSQLAKKFQSIKDFEQDQSIERLRKIISDCNPEIIYELERLAIDGPLVETELDAQQSPQMTPPKVHRSNPIARFNAMGQFKAIVQFIEQLFDVLRHLFHKKNKEQGGFTIYDQGAEPNDLTNNPKNPEVLASQSLQYKTGPEALQHDGADRKALEYGGADRKALEYGGTGLKALEYGGTGLQPQRPPRSIDKDRIEHVTSVGAAKSVKELVGLLEQKQKKPIERLEITPKKLLEKQSSEKRGASENRRGG